MYSFAKFVLIFLFSHSAFSAGLNISVLSYSEVDTEHIQKIQEGIQKFSELVENHCDLSLSIETSVKYANSPSPEFDFDPTFTLRKISDSSEFFFRFFQFSAFNALKSWNIQAEDNSVQIMAVRDLPGHCGFAFPKIQFDEESAVLKNRSLHGAAKIEKIITNKIILATPSLLSHECGDPARLVAHELAHIFVQDQTPHHCLNEKKGVFEPCPEDNLLATYKKVYPDSRPRVPGRPGFQIPGEENILPDEPIFVKAWGTSLNRHQCGQIRKTLTEIN